MFLTLIMMMQYGFLGALLLHTAFSKKIKKDQKTYELSQMGYASIPMLGIIFLVLGYIRYFKRVTA